MNLAAELATFTASHPLVSLTGLDHEAHYRASGTGRPAIVLLTGALGFGHFGFLVHRALEGRFRILAPDYPLTADPNRLLGGLTAMLDAERIDRAVIHGASFGGLIAQRLVERAPDRIAGLIVSHSGPVSASASPGWVLTVLGWLPRRFFQAALTKKLRALMVGADPAWVTLFDDGVARLGYQGLFARLRLAANLGKMPPGPQWRGPTLIIDSDNDPAVRPPLRAALVEGFPGAARHTFRGTGHLAPLLDPIGYAEIVAAFAAGLPG